MRDLMHDGEPDFLFDLILVFALLLDGFLEDPNPVRIKRRFSTAFRKRRAFIESKSVLVRMAILNNDRHVLQQLTELFRHFRNSGAD